MLAATLPTEVYFPAAPAAAAKIVQPHQVRRLEAFGDRLDLLLSGADTGGALAVFVQSTPAGSGPPPHRHHGEAEIFVVLEGELEYFVGVPGEGTWTRVAPGGAVFLPRGVPHTFRNVGGTPSRTLVVVLPGGFEQFFAGCADLFAAAGPDAPPDVAEVLRVADAHGIEFLVPLGPPPAA